MELTHDIKFEHDTFQQRSSPLVPYLFVPSLQIRFLGKMPHAIEINQFSLQFQEKLDFLPSTEVKTSLIFFCLPVTSSNLLV